MSASATSFDPAEFRTHPTDTGSPEVQVAQLTNRINNYTRHFRVHTQDKNNQRGMMMVIGQRKRLLQYLRANDIERYRSLIHRLGIRPLK